MRGFNAGHQPAVAIVRPAAAAPPRRPDPVEQRRAAETNKPKFAAPDSSAPTRQGDKGIKRTSPKWRRESTPETPALFGATDLVGELPRSNGQDRTSVAQGKRVDLSGRRIVKQRECEHPCE